MVFLYPRRNVGMLRRMISEILYLAPASPLSLHLLLWVLVSCFRSNRLVRGRMVESYCTVVG